MKKKILISSILILLVGATIINHNYNKSDVLEEEKTKEIKQENTLSMMLETEAGSGNYEMTTASSWPTEGYTFNSELSRCENGGELAWDGANKKVLMNGNVSDKCYVYFDKVSILLTDYIKSLYTGTQGENNIYYHDSSLTNGAGDNSYRYAGAGNVVNNFVCFGTSTSPCPTDNLYRIIGVFEDKVKLIKYDYANSNLLGTDGSYSSSKTLEKLDDASYYKGSLTQLDMYLGDSTLKETNLNINFINNIGEEWANKIVTASWKTGGNLATPTDIVAGVVPATAYRNEVVNPYPRNNSADGGTVYSAKIGLMYVSDYGFAAGPSAWTTILSKYANTSIISINWLYMGLKEYTIARAIKLEPGDDEDGYIESEQHLFMISSTGGVTIQNVAFGRGVRPAFYLSSSVTYKSGTGTQSKPIRID